jgi:hypothetical protein
MAAVVMDIDVIAAGREKAGETLVAGGVFGQAVIDLHHGRGVIVAGTWRTARWLRRWGLNGERRKNRSSPIGHGRRGKIKGDDYGPFGAGRACRRLLLAQKSLVEGQRVMECRNVSDLTLNQAIDNIYASIKNDNEELDSHIAALKAAMAREGVKEAVFEPSKLVQPNRQGRKIMQSYFKQEGRVSFSVSPCFLGLIGRRSGLATVIVTLPGARAAG